MSYPFQFSTLFTLIANQLPKTLGQDAVFLTIFKSILDDLDETHFPCPSSTSISRWVTGNRKIPAPLVEAVMSRRGEKQIREDIQSLIIDNIADVHLLIYQIIRLVREDRTYSAEERVMLLNYNPSFETSHSSYLAKAIKASVRINRTTKFDKIGMLDHFSEKTIPIQPLGRTVPSVRPFFTGRETDKKTIHQLLLANRVVFLYGPRGIGKSALAAEYTSSSGGFNDKVWLTYNNNLHQTIEAIVLPENDRDLGHLSPFERNFRWLQSLNKDSLIVLDNFDVLEEDEPLFHDFVNCGFSLLVTSHVHHESCLEYTVEEMPLEELCELFTHYYTKKQLNRSQIEQLISVAHSHTMVVEMTAKLMQNSNVAFETIISELQKSVGELALPVNVLLSKDGKTRNAIIKKHLGVLFDLSSLKDEDLRILIFMSYMPLDGAPEDLFSVWSNDPYCNSITQLNRLGWIERIPLRNTIKAHPIVREIAHSHYRGYEARIHNFVEKIVQHFKTSQEKLEDLCIRIAFAVGHRLHDFESVAWVMSQFENACNLQNCGRKNSSLLLMEEIVASATSISLPNYFQSFLHYRIGCLKLDMGEQEAALEEFEKALSIDAGKQVCEVAYCSLLVNCLLECSLAFAMKEKPTISSRFMSFAEKLLKELPESDEKTLQSRLYYKQGEILRLQGKHARSLRAFEDALMIRKELFGANSLETGLCHAQIGLAYRKLRKDYMAAKSLYTAYTIFDRILPETHPNLISVQLSLGITLENLTGKDLGMVQLLDYLSGTRSVDDLAESIPLLSRNFSELMENDPTESAISERAKDHADIMKPVAAATRNLIWKFTKPKVSVMRDEYGWHSYQFGRNYDPSFRVTHNHPVGMEKSFLFSIANSADVLDVEASAQSRDFHEHQAFVKLHHYAADIAPHNIPVHIPNQPMGSFDLMHSAIVEIKSLPPEILASNSKWFMLLTSSEMSSNVLED